MMVAALAMKGPALTWWLQWHPRHPWMNWDAFTSVFLWQFKPEWRVILPLPDDEEDVEFEPEQLTVTVVEQSTVVEEGISDFNQHCSSFEVADLEIADSIEDSLVQSQFSTKTQFNNEHTPLFFEPEIENRDGENKFQPYELVTEGLDTVPAVADEQKDRINSVGKDKDMRFDFDFNFRVPDPVRSSSFRFMKFGPAPPPKPPDRSLSTVSLFPLDLYRTPFNFNGSDSLEALHLDDKFQFPQFSQPFLSTYPKIAISFNSTLLQNDTLHSEMFALATTGYAEMTLTTISVMLPLQVVYLFDPGGTHLVTTPPRPKRRNCVVVSTSLLVTPILKLNLNLRNRPPEIPPYHDYRIEETTKMIDSTQFSIPKSVPSQFNVTVRVFSINCVEYLCFMEFKNNIEAGTHFLCQTLLCLKLKEHILGFLCLQYNSNCTSIKELMVEDVTEEVYSNMVMHFAMELLTYAYVSKCCVLVVMQCIYEGFDPLRWICGTAFVYGAVIFKKKSITLDLRFVLTLYGGVLLQLSWKDHCSIWLCELNPQGIPCDEYCLNDAYGFCNIKGLQQQPR